MDAATDAAPQEALVLALPRGTRHLPSSVARELERLVAAEILAVIDVQVGSQDQLSTACHRFLSPSEWDRVVAPLDPEIPLGLVTFVDLCLEPLLAAAARRDDLGVRRGRFRADAVPLPRQESP